ncbi:MAG TPA: aldehyde dehydrogenase family protein, partial [Acidimicrobiia bacterium]|nr:aldehyde dehydrogenase family protein [Acidimicrobiia bacterium]
MDIETHDDIYVDGAWRPAHSPERIPVVNPADEETIAFVPDGDAADVDAAVHAARRAFPDWAHTSPKERADRLGALAAALEARQGEIARVITAENGSPIAETAMAAAHAATQLRYYAGLADDLAAADIRPNPAASAETLVRREPFGVAALIVPWNFPLGLIVAKLAPALMAGCTTVVKPAGETPLDARLLAAAAQEAGLPAGTLNIVTGGRATGAALVEHPEVAKVAFTGSTPAGRVIAEACGRLLRPVTLELGGKSAAVLLDDVDLDVFAAALLRVTLRNTGQTCYACTRVVAPAARYRDIVDLIATVVSEAPQGDPLDPDTVFGPVVSDRQRARVEDYIRIGRDEGARIVVGGGRPSRLPRGFYVEPTVFASVDAHMRVAQEEIFGPVLTVLPYDGEDEAVRIANATPYGLGGAVFSADGERALGVADRLETGNVGVN